MSDLKNDLKNVPYIKQFFGEYLDLRKDKDNEALIVESIRNFYCFIGLECEFYGSDYRCYVDISADGADYGSGAGYRTE